MSQQGLTWQEQNDKQWEKLRFVLSIGRHAPLIWISSDSYHHLRTFYGRLVAEYPQHRHCRIDLEEYKGPSLTQFVLSRIPKDEDACLLHLFGIEKHLGIGADAAPPSRIFESLNFERERLFRDISYPLIFWSETFSQIKVQRLAPDFWDWIVYTFHFEAPPTTTGQGIFLTGLEPPAPGEERDAIHHRKARLLHLLQTVEENPQAGLQERTSLWLELMEACYVLREYQEVLHWANLLLAQKEASSPSQYAETLSTTATVLYVQGHYDTALGYLEHSLAIQQQIGDRKGESATLNSIGQVYHAKGDYDTALRYWELALAIRQQIGDRNGEGITLNNLAATAYSKGDYDTASRYLKQSLAILQQIGDRQGEGIALNNIGQVYHAKGDYDTASRYLEQSLAILQQIGDRQGEGATLNNIGQIYSAEGNYNTALRYLEQSLAIRQQIGDRNGEGATLNNIGQIYHAKGDYDTASRYFKQSIAIQQQIGDTHGMAVTLANKGALLLEQNRCEEALPLLMQAYAVFKKIGSPEVQVVEGYLGAIRERIGEARFRAMVSGEA